jgi:hypothetical protein
MSVDPDEFFEDETIDRRVPKRIRKTFDKRRAPTAARTTSHMPTKPASGLHHRRRRRYGI